MSKTQLPRNTLIKLIHTGQRVLGLDEDTYRDMLENITGLRSCAHEKMTDKKLTAVLAHMRERGFTASPVPPGQSRPAPPKSGGTKGRSFNAENLASAKQLGLVRGLWKRMYAFAIVHDVSDSALDAYCRRMVGKALMYCTTEQVQKLIECLKKWWQRAADPSHVAILENMLVDEAECVVQ